MHMKFKDGMSCLTQCCAFRGRPQTCAKSGGAKMSLNNSCDLNRNSANPCRLVSMILLFKPTRLVVGDRLRHEMHAQVNTTSGRQRPYTLPPYLIQKCFDDRNRKMSRTCPVVYSLERIESCVCTNEHISVLLQRLSSSAIRVRTA